MKDGQQERAPRSLLPTLMGRLGLDVTQPASEPTPLSLRIHSLQQAPLATLLAALDDEDESVRIMTLRALEQWGKQVPIESVLVCLNDPSWLVREAAILALEALGELASTHVLISDDNEFVRDTAAFVQQRNLKTNTYSSAIRNVGAIVFSTITAVDNFLLYTFHIPGNEGRPMNSQGDIQQSENTSVTEQRGNKRKVLGVTGGVLAVLVVLGVVFSWLAVTQKLPFTTTAQKKNLDAPLLTTTNEMQNPQIQWSSDSQYLIESTPYQLENATVVNINTKAEAQRNVFGLVANSTMSGDGVGAVPQFNWTPDGRYLITSSADDGTGQIAIEVWDAVAGHKLLAITYQDKTILRKPTNSNDFSNLPQPPPTTISPDDTRLALGKSDGTIEIWDIMTAKKIATYHDDSSQIQGMQWSTHHQKLLLSESTTGVVQTWDMATGKRLVLLHAPLIKQVLYSYDTAGQIIGQKQITVPTNINLSSDGTQMVASTDKDTFKIWNAATGQVITTNTLTLSSPSSNIDEVYWLHDNAHLVVISSDTTSKSKEIRTLDSNTYHTGLYAPIASDGFYDFSPSGKYLATESIDKKNMVVWDVATGRQISTYHNGVALNTLVQYGEAMWSPDERYIATMSRDKFTRSQNKVIQVWDVRTGKGIATYHSHSNQVLDVQWSPNGRYLASVSDGDVGNVFEVWQAPA